MSGSTPRRKASKVPSDDGRSWEARLLRKTRAEMVAHVGGKPSAAQRALIDRAAWLTLYIYRIDAKALAAGGTMTEHDSRQYLAWSNSLTRTLRHLGLKGAAERGPSLADHLAARERAKAAAA